MSLVRELDHYYAKHPEPNRGCLLALRQIILQQDDHISEKKKWGIPCFYYYNRLFCCLNVPPKTQQPYVLFTEGLLLDFPELEQGKRVRMKIFQINAEEDLPMEQLTTILQAALNLYKTGIIPFKK